MQQLASPITENNVIVITGQRGSGKTTYLKQNIICFDRVIIFDLLGEFTEYETAYTLKELFSLLVKRKNENFFVINYYNPKTDDEDFKYVCRAINRLNSVMFVVDELDYYCSASYSPKEFSEIIKRGRHQSIGIMVATRRPYEIPRLVTSQMTEFITFRHMESRDTDYVHTTCGFDKDEVRGLKNFEYFKWNSEGISRGKVNFPSKNDKGQPKNSAHLY